MTNGSGQLTGKVYDIQGFTVQDGPGIRTTIFLKGCPLHCPWCHSPESIRFESELNWMKIKCIGIEECGACLKVCPHKAITPGDLQTSLINDKRIQHIRVDKSLCDNCGTCADACPCNALYLCGTDYTADSLVERVKKDKDFFDNSGGGVTVSGGEPLSQFEFTLSLFKALKDAGLHAALDTTAFAKTEYIEAIAPYVDLFLIDLKHMDSVLHKAAVGVANERIHQNVRRLAALQAHIQIRVPVIPLFNDTVENFESLRDFALSLGSSVSMIQLLPYHNLGVAKLERIFNDKKAFVADKMSDAHVEPLMGILQEAGLPVKMH